MRGWCYILYTSALSMGVSQAGPLIKAAPIMCRQEGYASASVAHGKALGGTAPLPGEKITMHVGNLMLHLKIPSCLQDVGCRQQSSVNKVQRFGLERTAERWEMLMRIGDAPGKSTIPWQKQMFGCSSVYWHVLKLHKALCSAQAGTGDAAATFEAIMKTSHALLLLPMIQW